MASKDGETQSVNSDIANSLISAPDITIDSGELVCHRKAINNGSQAWAIFQNLLDAQSKRNIFNSEVLQKYKGDQPRNQQELINLNQDWRSNFPTLFLKGIIDRAIPNFIAAIDQMTQLTQAKLPDIIDGVQVIDADVKTRKFRDLFTRYVRTKWKKHHGYNDKLARELCIIGYCFSVYSDEDTPWPSVYDQSRARTYERSSQDSADWQVFCFDEDVLTHQFVDLIQNLKAAKDAGWILENCMKALNVSMPLSPSEDVFANSRAMVEAMQDLGTGASFEKTARGVMFGHVFAMEPDEKAGEGRVTHYILDRKSGEPLFARDRRFKVIEEVVQAFTLEESDDHVYGPQGLGRILVNISIAVDELVNDAVSQLKMNGLMVIKTTAQSALQAQMMVRAPFIVLKSDGEPLNKEQFPFDIDAFMGVYAQLQKLAEIAAGAYIANVMTTEDNVQSSGGRRTAREATIDYTRELQTKAAGISRFSGQYLANSMQSVQRRLTKKGSSHKDAKSFQKELKDMGLSDKEIQLLGQSPACVDVKDASGLEANKKAQAAATLVGNPLYDQKKVHSAIIANQVSQAFNDELMLKDAFDPNQKGNQFRLALIENDVIFDGEGRSMNVVPNDDDLVHFTGHFPEAQQKMQEMLKSDPMKIDPKTFDDLSTQFVHIQKHVDQSKAKKLDPATIKKAEVTLKGLETLWQAMFKQKQASMDQALKNVADAHADQANQFLADSAGGMLPQGGGEQGDMGPAQPAGQQTDMTEKTLVAWISKFEVIPDDSKQQLLAIGGIPSQNGATTPIPKMKPQDPAPSDDIGMPPLPDPSVPPLSPPSEPPEAPKGPEPVGPAQVAQTQVGVNAPPDQTSLALQ